MENKTCAFIRQTWYETAKKHLSEAERLGFYEMICNYFFYNEVSKPEQVVSVAVSMLFDMVKPTIEQDKTKADNIRIRNTINGAKGGRPTNNTNSQENIKPNETQENPSETQKKAIYNNNNNNNNNSNLFVSKKNETEHTETETKFLVSLSFFESGVKDPIKEGSKFWNYYAARGWELPQGGKIVDIVALSKTWRTDEPIKGLQNARKWATDIAKFLFRQHEIIFWHILSDFAGCEARREQKKLIFSFYGSEINAKLEEYSQYLDEWKTGALPDDWEIKIINLPAIE